MQREEKRTVWVKRERERERKPDAEVMPNGQHQ